VNPQRQAEVLIWLVRHMPDALVREAVQQKLWWVVANRYRAELLGNLVVRLPDSDRVEILQETLAEARQYPEHFASFGGDEGRAAVLEHLSLHLPGELISDAFALACSIQYDEGRERAMKALVPRLGELPQPLLYALWHDHLQRLALHERKSLLCDLHVLGPVIASLGGAHAVLDTIHTIDEVGRWWP
jgi:hypothetical protein